MPGFEGEGSGLIGSFPRVDTISNLELGERDFAIAMNVSKDNRALDSSILRILATREIALGPAPGAEDFSSSKILSKNDRKVDSSLLRILAMMDVGLSSPPGSGSRLSLKECKSGGSSSLILDAAPGAEG